MAVDLRFEAEANARAAFHLRLLAVGYAEWARRMDEGWGAALMASKALGRARAAAAWAARNAEVVLEALEREPDAVPDVVDDALSAALNAAEAARAAAGAWDAAAEAFQRAGDSVRAAAAGRRAELAREAARLALEARESLWGVLGASGGEALEAARRAHGAITAAYNAIKEAINVDLRPFDKYASNG